MIVWSPAMSVGVKRLDRDHRVLVGLINHLEAAVGRRFETRVVLAEVLEALVAYTRFHFNREERVLEACHYPELASHREEHAELTNEVLDLVQRFEGDPASLTPKEMMDFLSEWLFHHILLQDKDYRQFAENNAAAVAAAESSGHFDFSPFDVDVTEADLEQAS